MVPFERDIYIKMLVDDHEIKEEQAKLQKGLQEAALKARRF